MKESGVEWIGSIPTHWFKDKLKNYFHFSKGKNASKYTKEFVGEFGEFPVYSGQTENDGILGYLDSYEYVIECLFTTTVGAKVMTVKILNGKFSLSQNCVIMQKKKECDLVFFYYLLQSLFDYEKSRIPLYMQPSLRIEDLNTYTVFLPSINEQKKIASFLTGRLYLIDKIISDTQQSIAELKKYKKSLITEIVTKGLDKNIKMKDSEVGWIGKTPTNWNVVRIKNILSEKNEKSLLGNEEPLSMSQKFGLIPSKDMDNIPNAPASYVGNKKVEVNDLVFNKLKAHLGVFAVSNYDGIVSPDYAVYQVKNEVDVNFLEFLFKTPQAIGEFIKYSKGVGAGLTRLYTHEFFNIKIALPDLEEQKKIVKYLKKLNTAIDSLIIEKEKIIQEYEQYKKSLIYEYVTGKKQV